VRIALGWVRAHDWQARSPAYWRGLIDRRRPARPVGRERPPIALLRTVVDQPVPGARVARAALTVRGWSAWGDTPAVAVAVRVNGVLAGRATVGSEPRPDVAEALGRPGLAATGWTLVVDLSGLEDLETAELAVAVWADPSTPPIELDPIGLVLDDEIHPVPGGTETPPPVRVETETPPSIGVEAETPSSEYVAELDSPRREELIDGDIFRVAGWALHRPEPISRIDVLVNGRRLGSARLGTYRPDVGAVLPGPEAAVSGFEHWVDLEALPTRPSHVKIQLVARAGDARPQVVAERTAPVAPEVKGAERAERDALLGERRRRLVSRFEPPRSGDLDLVVFTHQLDYGGGQLWLDELLRGMGAGKGFPCTVIAHRDGPLRDALEGRGISVHLTSGYPIGDAETYEGRITELTALVASAGHNAALVNTATCIVGADVATRLGLPTVWAIHESLTPKAFFVVGYAERMDLAVRDAAERALAASDALVFVAEATRQLYARWARPDRTIVVPYGVDTQAIRSYCERVPQTTAREETGIPEQSKVLLVMGTIEPRKAQIRIAQAFENVRHDHPDWILVFVGDTGTRYGEGLKEYVRQVGSGDQVRVVPVVEDTCRWYRAADVLLSASDLESLPRSALEAMCFGVPVVAASVFGLPELIQDGRTGFLFEVNDLDALVAALRRVLGLDQAQLTAVGEAGRRVVVDRYDSAGYVADFRALLDGFSHRRDLTPKEILSRHGRVAPTEQRLVIHD
jgi:D-inositol-3-phosphate glycosyltransferase